MATSLESSVQYSLPLDDELIPLNERIGKEISMRYIAEIHCIKCGRKSNKSYSQGYCYPCFISLAACDMCIMKPETCHFHLGTCREPDWAEKNCMQEHYVYLANSSGVKVGITRGSQVPTRWMDQGASQALPVFKVSNRLLSGKIEVAIKAHVSDRTDWRKMLKAEADPVDLPARRDELISAAKNQLEAIADDYEESDIEFLTAAEVINIEYPVETYPEKVKSLNFDKTPEISGILQGIKGQYLILDCGVLNIRKFAGYQIELS
ncbi:MAG: DUF2797 domain-containing protein [Gammaproteobacteria bacterium]|nr:DUF2797 domain-containing protein [Gammaproteobacteria bacterium]